MLRDTTLSCISLHYITLHLNEIDEMNDEYFFTYTCGAVIGNGEGCLANAQANVERVRPLWITPLNALIAVVSVGGMPISMVWEKTIAEPKIEKMHASIFLQSIIIPFNSLLEE